MENLFATLPSWVLPFHQAEIRACIDILLHILHFLKEFFMSFFIPVGNAYKLIFLFNVGFK
jgi:hypothetical protein